MAKTRKQLKISDVVFAGVNAKRVAEHMTIRHVASGGCTSYKKHKVVSIAAPLVKGARARTIRVHELLHANNSPMRANKRFHPCAVQAVEDARLHAMIWQRNKMPAQVNRDCLATGLADMHGIPAALVTANADNWNIGLLTALRSMAIVSTLGDDKHKQALTDYVRRCFGTVVNNALADVLDEVKATHNRKALEAFQSLLREDDDNSGKGKGSSGGHTTNPMRIVRLDMPAPTSKTVRRISLARSGARLNRARLARAIASGSTSGLFIRQRYLIGGTYLFDASGSMHVSAARLNEICQKVPAARVAYYSGGEHADASGCYGELVIYADNNRRAVECTNMHGGNSVDLFALLWLLEQPAPRVFVCDGGFCGGPAGQDIETAKLLSRAIGDGEVILYSSIQALEDELARVQGKRA